MNLVKELRERKGWSQEHLAAVSGVGKRTIQRVEAGEVLPSAETAMALAEHLETLPNEIMNWSGLRSHLRACLAAWNSRPPTKHELQGVPSHLRPLFAAFHDGMASLKSCQDSFARLTEESHRLHERAMSILDESGADLRAVSLAVDPASALEALNRIMARRAAWDDAQALQADLRERLRQTSERMMRTSREIARVASRLDRELDAYDVFSVSTPPTATRAAAP